MSSVMKLRCFPLPSKIRVILARDFSSLQLQLLKKHCLCRLALIGSTLVYGSFHTSIAPFQLRELNLEFQGKVLAAQCCHVTSITSFTNDLSFATSCQVNRSSASKTSSCVHSTCSRYSSATRIAACTFMFHGIANWPLEFFMTR